MGKMNWTRVFLGALASWVVFDLLWVAAWFLYMESEMTAAWKALGLEFSQLRTPGFTVFWLVLTYVGGVMAIWLYAAIRPRYGPGLKTAVVAGLAGWLIGNFLLMISLGVAGVFSMRFVTMYLATNLVRIVAATVVGAWLYKEE